MPDPTLVRNLRLAAAGLLGLWATLAGAQETAVADPGLGVGLRLSGFATVGLARSDAPSPWALRRDALIQPDHAGSDLRAGIDSRIGLQANYVMTPQWDAVAQVVLQPQASTASWLQRLEWAYVGWRPNQTFTLHAGRVATDTFLLDDYRNVGFAYPWVRPNVEFYSGIPNHIDGVDVAARIPDEAGDWRIKLVAGRDDYVSPSDSGDIHLHLRHAGGVLVSHESAGLTLRGSASMTRFQGQASPLRLLAAGAVWEEGGWNVSAEYSDGRAAAQKLVRRTGYLSVGRRIGDFTPFAMTSRAVSRVGNPGALLGLGGEPPPAPLSVPVVLAGIFDESANSIGMRWDWNSRADLKFQWDRFDVRPYGGALWDVIANPQARTINVLSVVVDTVF